MIDLSYSKSKTARLFESFKTFSGTKGCQNYIPLYNKFFSLNETNFNSFNLTNKFRVDQILERKTDNVYLCSLIKTQNKEDKATKGEVFIKFSPLMDPIKYITGKYNIHKNIFNLPNLSNNKCHKKMIDPNNAAYTDGFFYFLSNRLVTDYSFPNGIKFYGSYLGTKTEYEYDISDDIEYLCDSDEFYKNKDNLFSIANFGEFFNSETRNYKAKLNISEKSGEISVTSANDDMFEGIFKGGGDDCKDISNNLVFQFNITKKTNSSSSTCSSRSSHTSGSESEEEEDDLSDCSSTDSESSILIKSKIFNYPIQMICLEKLEDTLDNYINEKDMDQDEWKSCLLQIILSLITYNKAFDFVHNDLHSNNIMYIKTDKKWLYYCYNKTYYKVPTFGKIYKLIDFGRATYSFKNVKICSDSFHPKGDAATQYNYGPYYNKDKPLLKPNKSFDLCRLACSLYDYFNDDQEEDPISKLVLGWCKDDKGKNVMYKKNGMERYPDFKLYKMIARCVHNHTPEAQLPFFSKFVVSKKKILKKKKIFNIDSLQSYV